MIKFVDIDNGYIFDGTSYVETLTCKKCGCKINNNTISKNVSRCPNIVLGRECGGEIIQEITGPHHIFWFDDAQSTDIYYIKKICILTDDKHGYFNPLNKKHILPISISNNNIFKLVDINEVNHNENILYNESVNGFDYVDLNRLTNRNNITIEGESYGDYYVHMLYILAKSTVFGEFIEDIYIDDTPYTIGADFYEENESLYINLSNFGFDVSKDIQKAIYSSNVHEDYTDNILINRKLKELLINFWDIVANRGSQKSLINSLNWFEWGDLVKVKEIWSHDIGGKTLFFDKEIQSILADKYQEILSHFSKSTYLGLYSALEKISTDNNKVLYDSEKNPVLEFISSKWSFNDLSLKMSMLGKFYEMFFMPIHLDLIHYTIEDIVFLNTIKINQSLKVDRTDYVTNFIPVTHNVSEEYYMTTLETFIPNNTKTAIIWDDYNYDILEDNGEESDTYYNGLGVSIPVNIKVPVFNDEFVKSITILSNLGDETSLTETWKVNTINKLFKNKIGSNIEIDFNLICCKEYEYDIRLQIETNNCNIYTTQLLFKTIDIDNIKMSIYKYKKKSNLSPNDFGAVYVDIDNIEGDMLLNETYINGSPQYLQTTESDVIGKNHVIVLNGDYVNNNDDFFENYYTVLYKNDENIYTVCISKEFGFEPTNIPQFLLEVMYNNGYKYFSEFYDMTELKGNSLNDYTINDNENLYMIMDIEFGKYIKSYNWIFENLTNGNMYYPQLNIYSPFASYEDVQILDKGFYSIIFEYELHNGTKKSFKLNGAFYKK